MADDVEPGSQLVVGLDHSPRRFLGRGRLEHLDLRGRIVLPFLDRREVDRRDLPALQRVVVAGVHPLQLRLLADRQIELDEPHAVAHQHAFELRRFFQELVELFLGAKTHYPLDAGAVVPGAIVDHHFTGGRQVVGVALEVPLALLDVGRLRQRDDAGGTRIEMLGQPGDGAALAGGVAALEHQHQPLAALDDRVLQLQKLDLQRLQLFFVALALHFRGIGVVAGDQRRLVDCRGEFGVFEVECLDGGGTGGGGRRLRGSLVLVAICLFRLVFAHRNLTGLGRLGGGSNFERPSRNISRWRSRGLTAKH